jgi:hypothetical protein
MLLFDFYIMVDWSGAARRRGMRTDAIWVAYGGVEAENPTTVSPFSRTEAIQIVHSLLDDQLSKKLRVLVGFDFAYGYPRDFSVALQTATGKADATLPWLTVWRYLSDAIKDDEGTVPHRRPTNCSNRHCHHDRELQDYVSRGRQWITNLYSAVFRAGHSSITGGGRRAKRQGSNLPSAESRYPPLTLDRFQRDEQIRTKADFADPSRGPIPTSTVLDHGP